MQKPMTKEQEQVMNEWLLEEVAFLNEIEEQRADHSCYDNRDREDTSNGFICKVCCFDYPF